MRIVVKVGTSTLTHATGRLNIRHVETLCKVLSDIKNAGHEIVLVSSGAIGMGVGKLNLRERPADMPTKQAAAAVGQCVGNSSSPMTVCELDIAGNCPCSAGKSCSALCDPMDCSTPGFPVLHYLPELAQTHVH